MIFLFTELFYRFLIIILFIHIILNYLIRGSLCLWITYLFLSKITCIYILLLFMYTYVFIKYLVTYANFFFSNGTFKNRMSLFFSLPPFIFPSFPLSLSLFLIFYLDRLIQLLDGLPSLINFIVPTYYFKDLCN